jgi:hypothetical protein
MLSGIVRNLLFAAKGAVPPVDYFDWVSETHNVSAKKVFENLRQEISRDLHRIQEIAGAARSGDLYELLGNDPSMFNVYVKKRLAEHSRVFRLVPKDNSIVVTDEKERTVLEAKPFLSEKGKQVVKIGEQVYPLWFLRKLALEDLFFDSKLWET